MLCENCLETVVVEAPVEAPIAQQKQPPEQPAEQIEEPATEQAQTPQTPSLPEPTEASLKKGIDKGFDAFFAKRGRKMPHVSGHVIGALSVEALEMIEAY